MITLLDIAKSNGNDAVVGLIDEAQKAHPEIAMGGARTIKGMSYRTLVRTALGNTSGSFRNANEGTAAITHTYENRLVQTYILEPRFEVDKALADRHEDGAAAYMAIQASGTMEGELQALAKCFFYGTNATHGNAKAFPGLLQAYDATNMVVDAAGTTGATGSSVWLVRFGPQHVQWVWGEGGKLDLGDVRVESLTDAGGTNKYDGYVQTMLAYPGLQVGSTLSVVRIKKLTADVGKGLTDDLLTAALMKFPIGTQPDAIFMTRRSGGQLQSSRTATNPTGTPAPWPRSFAGLAGQEIPIMLTDAISDVEALTL